MEGVIAVALIVIAYAVIDFRVKISNHIKYKNSLDLDYPYYPVNAVSIAQMEMNIARKSFDEKKAIRDEYWGKNEEKLRKVKKNNDHSKELKPTSDSLLK